MNAFVESHIGSLERVATESAEHVGGIDKRFCLEQRQSPYRQHRLRPIDQRDSFLGLKHQRLDLCALQSFGAWNADVLLVDALAFADERQSEMSQRSQIAA